MYIVQVDSLFPLLSAPASFLALVVYLPHAYSCLRRHLLLIVLLCRLLSSRL
ncbi:hypothetical protein BD311DRAFT_771113, partial [Dichomitus squalens]